MEDRFSQQLKKGVLEMLVLKLICDCPTYGYELILRLKEQSKGLFLLKEGTLYPVLHQLEREGCLDSYSAQAPSGRTRKYYHLTPKGVRVLEAQEAEYRKVTGAVEQVLRRSGVLG